MTLSSYFRELLKREGEPFVRLVARWQTNDVQNIRHSLQRAFASCNLRMQPLHVAPGLFYPAMCNKLADYYGERMTEHLRALAIKPCSGQGYPDRRLVLLRNGRSYALELKATHAFEPKSTQRIILTCSSAKLRRHFKAPIKHLVVTLLYDRQGSEVRILDQRLDFLEPSTKVKVRLEASVSQRLLTNANHASFWQGEAKLAA